MAKTSINILKEWFAQGKRPTGEQFASLLDSYRHKDDSIAISDVYELGDKLNNKLGATGDGSSLNVEFYIQGDEWLSGDDTLEALFESINRFFYELADRISKLEDGVKTIHLTYIDTTSVPDIGKYAYNPDTGKITYMDPKQQVGKLLDPAYDTLYINDDAASDYPLGIYAVDYNGKLASVTGFVMPT